MGKKNKVPKTKNKQKYSEKEQLARNIIHIIELQNAVIKYLQSKRRLTKELYARLSIENEALIKVIFSVFKLTKKRVSDIVSEIRDNPNFEDDVKNYADKVSPEKSIVQPYTKGDMDNIIRRK